MDYRLAYKGQGQKNIYINIYYIKYVIFMHVSVHNMCVYIYVYMCVYVYMCPCINIYLYTHISAWQ